MEFSGDKKVFVAALISFAAFLVLLKLSGFSASVMVNFQNYLVKSIILGTAGMSTVSALYFVISPFFLVFAALACLSLAISILCYQSKQSNEFGKFLGVAAGLLSVVIFPSLWGVSLAIAVLLCSLYAPRFADMYSKELKKWNHFRTGSHTAGKVLLIANIVIATGLFVSVLYSQPDYEASFKSELLASMKSIAMSLPGASSIPPDVLNARLESAVSESPLFSAYIRWLPVSTAFSAWVLLEILRNLILSNLSGIFTYALLRKSES